jgi:carboxylesterase type B
MIKALQWVSENIAAFHGNPDQVTLWGESSGAFAVGQLLMAYGGKKLDGLFHQTIAESGSASSTSYNGTDWHQPIYNRIVDAVGCGRSDDTLDCLRSVPYDTLYPHLDFSTLPGPGWYPTVDGDVIPDFPTKLLKEGRFAKLPQLNGVTSDEGTSISALPALLDTDDQLRDYLIHRTGFGYPENVITKIVELYPSTPALGVRIPLARASTPHLLTAT